MLGVAVQVDWYRDGKHIGVFANDNNYDFNFQDARHFESNKKLLPVSNIAKCRLNLKSCFDFLVYQSTWSTFVPLAILLLGGYILDLH